MIPPACGPYRYSKCIHAHTPRIFPAMEISPKICHPEDLAKNLSPGRFAQNFSPAKLGQKFFYMGIAGKVVQKEQFPEAAMSFCGKMVFGLSNLGKDRGDSAKILSLKWV